MTRKIALITGASRGLGKSAALHLAAQGVDIIGTYHSAAAEAQAVVEQIQALGGRAAMLQLDVSQSGTFNDFVGEVSTVLKDVFAQAHFNFLINNAGIGAHASFAETTEEQFDRLVAIHFKAPFFLTQKVAAADQRWRAHHQYLQRPGAVQPARVFGVCLDEGRG